MKNFIELVTIALILLLIATLMIFVTFSDDVTTVTYSAITLYTLLSFGILYWLIKMYNDLNNHK